jgi:hypothetical protein
MVASRVTTVKMRKNWPATSAPNVRATTTLSKKLAAMEKPLAKTVRTVADRPIRAAGGDWSTSSLGWLSVTDCTGLGR